MPEERLESRLSAGAFLREDLARFERRHVLSTFGAHQWVEARPDRWIAAGTDALVDAVDLTIGDGKEATVYRCHAAPARGFEWAVAKVYRAQKFRAFAGASRYRGGRQLRDRRQRKAVERRTRVGRQIAHAHWIEREWETLCRVYDAGADVPAPYAHSSDAILMEYVGDGAGPAPLLQRCRLDAAESRRAFEELLRTIEIFLACDRIHADLSAYNVLWWEGRARVIDLPQAVAATAAPDAFALLDRDVRNVCRHFARRGPEADPAAITGSLWRRWQRGQL